MKKRSKSIICQYCGKICKTHGLHHHLQKVHHKTTEEHTILYLNLNTENWPLCPYCKERPLAIEGFVLGTSCGRPECRKADIHQRRSKSAKLAAAQAIERGTFSGLRKNRAFTEDGKDIRAIKINQTRIKNGTHHFLRQNRPVDENGKDIYAEQIRERNNRMVKEGSFWYLSKNRKKDPDTGKDLIAMRLLKEHKLNITQHIHDYEHLYDKEFLEEKFVDKDGLFDVNKMMTYFNIGIATANYVKRECKVYIPNNSEVLTGSRQREVIKYLEHFIKYPDLIENYRHLISPKEVDIYIPKIKLAIEFDGIYWHCNSMKEPDNMLAKTQLCEAQQVCLLHIMDNEWNTPELQTVWKSKLQHKLQMSQRVYARQCDLVLPSALDIKAFLCHNSLQPDELTYEYSYGLIFCKELVAVMTFERGNSEHDYIVKQFCVKCGLAVLGGFSKLLAAHKRTHQGTIQLTINKRWSDKNSLLRCGFKLKEKLPPQTFFTRDCIHLTTLKYQNLPETFKKLLPKENEVDKKQMEEVLERHGYKLIQDAGYETYTLTN